jgi:WD40 repeat protein
MLRARFALLALALTAVLPAARTGAQPAPAKAHAGLVHAVAVSPDGKVLATAGFDGVAKLWDAAADGTLKEKKALTGHAGPVYGVAFHPTDAKLIATASQDKTARIWDATDGKMKLELKGHADIVSALAFSPDGKALATGGADKNVKLWNPADGKELKALGAHDGGIYALAFSPDGKVLASAGAGKDNIIKLWDVAGQKELKQIKGHEGPVTGVAFADNDTLITTSMDRTIRVWTLADGKEKKKLGSTTDDPYGLAWHAGTKTVAVCGYSGKVTFFALDADKPKHTAEVKNPGYCVALSADGKFAFSGHDNGTVAVSPSAGK